MKLEEVTIHIYGEDLETSRIDITDSVSGITIFNSIIDNNKLASIIRGNQTAITGIISDNIERLNKVFTTKVFEFEIPFGIGSIKHNMQAIQEIGIEKAPEGWKVMNDYTEKSFCMKDNKSIAKVTISKWV